MAGYPAYVRLSDGSKVLVQNEEEEKALTKKPDAKAKADSKSDESHDKPAKK